MDFDRGFDQSPGPEKPSDRAGVPVDLSLLLTAGRGVHESRRNLPSRVFLDVSDLIVDACRRGAKVGLDRCGNHEAAVPMAVETCARRVLDIALTAFGPPVSQRVDVHLCGIVGQVGIQVTAVDRHSHRRLVSTEVGRRAVAELSVWLGAFSPLFSVDPLRRSRANVAAVLPFDSAAPWALPKCSSLRFGAG